MADDENKGGAQARLGELFVDFGTKGLGSLMKGLNKVQAQFLLTKNAGEQFVKTLVNLPKKANDAQVGFDKIASITNLTVKQLRQIDTFAKEKNITNFTNDIISMEQAILKLRYQGKGDMSAYGLIGIDLSELDDTKPLENWLKIGNAILDLQTRDRAKAYMVAQMFGFDADSLRAVAKWNEGMKTRIELTKDEENQLRRNADASGHLAAAWVRAGEKILANMPWLDNLIEKFAQLTEQIGNASILLRNLDLGDIGAGIAGTVGGAAIGGAVGGAPGAVAGAATGSLWMLTSRAIKDWRNPKRKALALKGAIEGGKTGGMQGILRGAALGFIDPRAEGGDARVKQAIQMVRKSTPSSGRLIEGSIPNISQAPKGGQLADGVLPPLPTAAMSSDFPVAQEIHITNENNVNITTHDPQETGRVVEDALERNTVNSINLANN